MSAPVDTEFEAKRGWSENTRRMRAAHWSDFVGWCAAEGRDALPCSSTTLGNYLDQLVAQNPMFSTVRNRVVAIGQVHEVKGLSNPTHTRFISEKVFGARLELRDGDFAKTTATEEVVHRMVRAIEDDNPTKQLRDRSILLIAAATSFKRHELVSLQCEALHWRPDGLQFAAPRKDRVPYHQDADVCPVRTLQAWLDAAAITSGPLFCAMDRWGNLWPRPLCARTVSRLVKRAADAAGLDPEEWSSSSMSRT